jgi:hypothetical protein
MAQLTAQGRTGKSYCERLLRTGADIRTAPLSLRKDLAIMAIRRLMAPRTRSENLLVGVVSQAIRDIGARPQDESLLDWHAGHLDCYLEAFGVEPECVQHILKGLGLWDKRDFFPLTKWRRQSKKRVTAGVPAAT